MTATEKNILESDLTMAFIDFDVDMLERYLDVVEAELQKAKEREISAYRDRLRGKNEAHGEEAAVDLQAIDESHEQFVHFQRYAFFMLVFMIFESRAKELCKYFRDDRQLSLDFADLHGNLTEKLKLYLCRYAKVLDEKCPLWQHLHDLQLVRNKIAHRGGICTKEETKKLEAPLRKLPGFRLERDVEGFRIDLNHDSCRYAVSTIKHFFVKAGRKAGFRNESLAT